MPSRKVQIGGAAYTIKDDSMIGEGGEARVYLTEVDGVKQAVKLYKTPNDPSLAGDTEQDKLNRKGAKLRLEKCGEKLMAFPRLDIDRVIMPRHLVHSGNKIVGYTMNLVPDPDVLRRYSEANFRQGGIDTNDVIKVLVQLHDTVGTLHKHRVVIGDFNDLNILVNLKLGPFIIDADSFQYGKFICQSFTQRFADPTLCDPSRNALLLCNPHNEDSDWYAFAVMVFQSLLFVGPYDGIYRPKKKQQVKHDARPLHRITVLDSDVKYPKFAKKIASPDYLPDDLLDTFDKIFHDDKRGEFPLHLLESTRWTKCTCGAEHARAVCPKCTAPGIVKSVMEVKGTVTSERIFKTSGTILCSSVQGGRIRWLYHECGTYYREPMQGLPTGHKLFDSKLEPRIRYRVNGDITCLAKDNQWLAFDLGMKKVDSALVDCFGALPVYDANSKRIYWAQNGRLLARAPGGAERTVGQVVSNQTLFWIGEKFGFGFYKAGELYEFFVFDSDSGIIRDGVSVPPIKGHLYDTACSFSSDRCWFFVSYQDGGKAYNRCTLISKDGVVLGNASEDAKGDTWLSGIRGKCAVGHTLFAATDDGIQRIEQNNAQLLLSKVFPDTEPFVEAGCNLLQGNDGLYVVTNNEIRLLKIT